MMQGAMVDSYYTRVETLLRDRKVETEVLKDNLERLTYDLAHVVEGVVLRPFPLDMEIIPGHKDPQSKIENDIRKIHQENKWCTEEIDRVVEKIIAYQTLERFVYLLGGKDGDVIRGLYYENCTWDALQDRMQRSRHTLSEHRRRGIQKLADMLYIMDSKIERNM